MSWRPLKASDFKQHHQQRLRHELMLLRYFERAKCASIVESITLILDFERDTKKAEVYLRRKWNHTDRTFCYTRRGARLAL